MSFNNIQTIRYMGNKNKLLDFVIPEIINITPKNEIVCDLMAGTNSIAYALKDEYTVYSNDVQYYSFIIGKALIENNEHRINSNYAANLINKINTRTYNFFTEKISDTYFSKKQCEDIDLIRESIDLVNNEYIKSLLLVALMNSMCKCQSTTGHFAQYLPLDNPRVKLLRNMSILDEYYLKCDELENIYLNNNPNLAFNMDYKDLIKDELFRNVGTVYIDTPYTAEQYSRFYHVLETVCKYDNPELNFKGLYRCDRYKSNFSVDSKAKDEFDYMIRELSLLNKRIVLSYSNKGILSLDELSKIMNKYYTNVELKQINYNHSTQGKGSNKIQEVIFIAK